MAIPWLGYACGACEYCASGRETLCPNQQMSGYTVNGAYAEYALAEASFVGHVPQGLDPLDAAPLTCAGVTTYKAIKVSGARSSDLVAIFGVGGLGHLAVQYARIAGASVAAVDLVDSKLDLAKELGAEHTINAAIEDPQRPSKPSGEQIRQSLWLCHRRRVSRRFEALSEAGRWSLSDYRLTTTCVCQSLKRCFKASR